MTGEDRRARTLTERANKVAPRAKERARDEQAEAALRPVVDAAEADQ